MLLTLSNGDSLTDETLVRDWATAFGAAFHDQELGQNLCSVLTSHGIRSLGTLRARTRTEVRELLAGDGNLGVFLLDDIEKRVRYGIADTFKFATTDRDEHVDKKPKVMKGGGTTNSFAEHLATFPHGYDEDRDIQFLPEIIVNNLPVKKQLGVRDGLAQVTSAVVAFMLLKYNAVHYCHPDERDLVRKTVVRISKLIVEEGYTVEQGTRKAPVEVVGTQAAARIVEAIRNKMVQTKQMVREAKSPDDYPAAKKPRLVFKISKSEHERCKELLEAGFHFAYQVDEYLLQDHGLDTTPATIAKAAPPQPSPAQPQPQPLQEVLTTAAGPPQDAAAAGAGPWGDAQATTLAFHFGGGSGIPRAPHVAPPAPDPPAAKAAAATSSSSKRSARTPGGPAEQPNSKSAKKANAAHAKQAKPAEQAEQPKAAKPPKAAKQPKQSNPEAEDANLFGEGIPFTESALGKDKRLTMLPRTEVEKLSRTNEDMLGFTGYGAKDIRVAVLWDMDPPEWFEGFFNHLTKKVVYEQKNPDMMWVGWCDGDAARSYKFDMSDYDGVTPGQSWVLLRTNEPQMLF